MGILQICINLETVSLHLIPATGPIEKGKKLVGGSVPLYTSRKGCFNKSLLLRRRTRRDRAGPGSSPTEPPVHRRATVASPATSHITNESVIEFRISGNNSVGEQPSATARLIGVAIGQSTPVPTVPRRPLRTLLPTRLRYTFNAVVNGGREKSMTRRTLRPRRHGATSRVASTQRPPLIIYLRQLPIRVGCKTIAGFHRDHRRLNLKGHQEPQGP
ncbi:hypothetical protein EVAR_79364_1 [Eumeta japonica]|uniref:Uncharacterized protein n=1 Tax=Eumeta variegata TaxID=151549 RepID=A0A4C1TG04_EUMVA|nr:hypothetical protein EVAR_79364_1 [Eumeta japonica]